MLWAKQRAALAINFSALQPADLAVQVLLQLLAEGEVSFTLGALMDRSSMAAKELVPALVNLPSNSNITHPHPYIVAPRILHQ